MTDKNVNVEEAAKLMELSQETIRRYLRAGLLKGIKLRREWRIPVSEIDRLIREGVKEAKPEGKG